WLESENSILAAIVGLRRRNGVEFRLPEKSKEAFFFHLLLAGLAQSDDLDANHAFSIFVSDAPGNHSGDDHAKQHIADLVSGLQRKHRSIVVSPGLVLLVHKPSSGSKKPVAAGRNILEKEMAVAIGSGCKHLFFRRA